MCVCVCVCVLTSLKVNAVVFTRLQSVDIRGPQASTQLTQLQVWGEVSVHSDTHTLARGHQQYMYMFMSLNSLEICRDRPCPDYV